MTGFPGWPNWAQTEGIPGQYPKKGRAQQMGDCFCAQGAKKILFLKEQLAKGQFRARVIDVIRGFLDRMNCRPHIPALPRPPCPYQEGAR